MQYTLLFRIECLHGYFGGGPCRTLTLAPTEDCKQMLDRYRMLFRGAAGGGAVYCLKQSPPDLLSLFDETAAFTFAMTSSDPALNNYTEIDLGKIDPADSIFHFDNRSDYATTVSGQRRQLLHPPGNPFAQAALSIRPKMFEVPARGGADVNRLEIREPLGSQTIWQGPVPQKGSLARVDLRKVPEGLYMLSVPGNPAWPFYVSERAAVERWGVVSIYPGGLRQASYLPESCRVIDSDGSIHPRTFSLVLESRKTFWRYYIIPSTGEQNFAQYEVLSAGKRATVAGAADGEVPFALLPETMEVDGRAAWVFESKSPLPFLLSPANAFSLSLRPNKNGKLGQRAIRLPYAQPISMVRKQDPEQKQLCSEIFVYV